MSVEASLGTRALDNYIKLRRTFCVVIRTLVDERTTRISRADNGLINCEWNAIRACPYRGIPILILDAKRGGTSGRAKFRGRLRKLFVHEKILASMKRKHLAYRAFVYFCNQRHTRAFTYENSFGDSLFPVHSKYQKVLINIFFLFVSKLI